MIASVFRPAEIFSSRFGYADFATEEEAKSALDLTDSELDSRKIRIDISTPRDSGTPRGGRGGRGKIDLWYFIMIIKP